MPDGKFLRRVFVEARRTRSITNICKCYIHYTWGDNDQFADLIKTINLGLHDYDYDEVKPFLMLLQFLLAKPSDNFQAKLDYMLQNFLDSVKNNCNYYRFMETMFEFIFKITSRYEHVRTWFYGKSHQLQFLAEWVRDYKSPP